MQDLKQQKFVIEAEPSETVRITPPSVFVTFGTTVTPVFGTGTGTGTMAGISMITWNGQ